MQKIMLRTIPKDARGLYYESSFTFFRFDDRMLYDVIKEAYFRFR